MKVEILKDTKMHCANCHANTWEVVDRFRIKPQGMAMCTECGFISYPAKWKSPEEIKAHYRTDYRQPPTHNNLFAGERKNHFHHKFLHDLFEVWRANGLENPRILEVGAASGFTLAWIRSLFPKAEIYGTELTLSMRRNAMHEFGVKLTEEIDESKEYDLIMSYKVLEHQLEPLAELVKYAHLLKPDGRLYISVPTWFNSIYNFGMGGFDIEYYYDPNHINVWTTPMFESLLGRAGFDQVKNDQTIYASTYLCRPSACAVDVVRHDPNVVKENMNKILLAFLHFQENRFDEALALWPDYPQAHASRAEMSRRLLTEKGWEFFRETFIERAMRDCPTSADMVVMACDFAMRASQWTEAIEYAEQALQMKPENPSALLQLSNIMREIAIRAKTAKERNHYFLQAREVAKHLRHVSTQHFREATDLIYFYNSKLPFPGEVEQEKKPEPAKLALTAGTGVIDMAGKRIVSAGRANEPLT
jgi:SAM-dependent methyltransferase